MPSGAAGCLPSTLLAEGANATLGESPGLSAFSRDASHLVVAAGDGRLRVHDTVNGRLEQQVTPSNGHLDARHSSLCWLSGGDHEGPLLAVGTKAGDVAVFDAILGKEKWRLGKCHSGPVVGLGQDGGRGVLYTAGEDGVIGELSPESGAVRDRWRAGKKSLSCFCVSDGGEFLLTGSSKVSLWRAPTRELVCKFPGHERPPFLARFDPSGNYALTAAHGECDIAFWECSSEKAKRRKKKRDPGRGAQAFASLESPPVAIETAPKRVGFFLVAIASAGDAYLWQCEPPAQPSNFRRIRIEGTSELLLASCLVDSTVVLARGSMARPSFQRVAESALEQDTRLEAQEDGVLLPRQQGDEHASLEQPWTTERGAHVLGKEAAAESTVPRASAKKRRAAEAIAPTEEDDEGREGGRQLPFSEVEDEEEEQAEPSLWEKIRELELSQARRGDQFEGGGEEEAAAFRRSLPAGRAPKADSLAGLLSQAVRANDVPLLERCMSVSDESIIGRTVKALAPDEAVAFLALAVERLQSRPQHGLQLARWIKAVLHAHASYLASASKASSAITALYQMVESRLSLYRPLLQLSGRLDLLLHQRGSSSSVGASNASAELAEVGDHLRPVRSSSQAEGGAEGAEEDEDMAEDDDDDEEEDEDDDEDEDEDEDDEDDEEDDEGEGL